MTILDPYRITDRLDQATLDVIIARLEARGRHPLFVQMLARYLDAVDVDAAKTVLDMGCGTGVAARAIAGRPGFAGHVTGIDLSPTLVSAATRYAADERLGDRVTFLSGDTRRLELRDASFDVVVAHTLVSHVTDPGVVIGEAARVVRPGGAVAIFDGDYASMTFGNADPDRGKAYDEILLGAVVTSPRVMRQMPRLLKQAGLQAVAMFPHVVAEFGRADFWMPGIKSFRHLLPKSGAMSEAEAGAWIDSLLRDSDDGVFFGAGNYYSYVARRP